MTDLADQRPLGAEAAVGHPPASAPASGAGPRTDSGARRSWRGSASAGNPLQGIRGPRHVGHDRGAGEHTGLDAEADARSDLEGLAEIIGVHDERTIPRDFRGSRGSCSASGHAQNPLPQKPLAPLVRFPPRAVASWVSAPPGVPIRWTVRSRSRKRTDCNRLADCPAPRPQPRAACYLHVRGLHVSSKWSRLSRAHAASRAACWVRCARTIRASSSGLPLPPGELPVFVYHDVDPAQFAGDLEFLRRNRYRTLSLGEFATAAERERPLGARGAADLR